MPQLVLPNILWEIDNLLEANEQSTLIDFMGMKWSLAVVLLPNISDRNSDAIQLTLERLSPVLDLQADKLNFSVTTTITVHSQNMMTQYVYATVSYRKWSLHNTKVGDIKKYVPNFTFSSPMRYNIFVGLYGSSANLGNLQNVIKLQRTQIPMCLSSLSKDLSKLLTDDEHSDAVLTCHDKSFRIHKAILSARSDVFDAMFRGDMKEKREGTVCITDMEPAILEQLLHYLYSGNLSDLSLESACKLHAAADKYQVDALKVKCAIFIAETYAEEREESNSEVANNTDVEESLVITEKNLLKMLFKSMEWKKLTHECPELASAIFSPFFLKYILTKNVLKSD